MTIVLQIDALTGGFRGNQKTHLSLAEGFRGLMPPYCFLRLRTMFSGKSQTFISVDAYGAVRAELPAQRAYRQYLCCLVLR